LAEAADPRTAIKHQFLSAHDWDELLPELAAYYAAQGAGLFGQFRAFRWTGEPNGLEGIADPDAVRLEDLIAYDTERELLIRNTAHLVAGFTASNVLIYGDRGTGKSSTIKALANAYADRRLRLVELPKSRLRDFPVLLRLLRGRPERF